MATRYFNWKLAIVLVVAVAVFVVAAVVLHHWQKTTRAEHALTLGEKAYAAKNWEEAANQLGRHLAVNGKDVEALIKYADAQMKKRPVVGGNVQLAIQAYRAVLRDHPEDVETAKRLVEVYLNPRIISLPSVGEAKLIAERHLAIRDNSALRRLFAQTLWYQRDYDGTVAELRKVIEKDPCEVEAFEFMGRIAEIRPETAGDPAKWFNDAVSKNPDSALAYIVRAAYRLRHDDKDQAVADLTHALTCDLSDVSVRLRVIAELTNAGEWDKAKEQLDALQAASPDEIGLWTAWANLAIKRMDKEAMRKVAEDGMKAMDAGAWDFMPIAVRLLILSSDLVKKDDGSYTLSDQAKIDDYLSQLRNKEIDLPMVAYLQGLAAERQGRLSEAVTHWQRAISASGVDEQTLLSAHRGLASAFSRLGDYRSAIGQLQVLLSKSPEDIYSQLELARLYAQVKNWSKVLEEARRVQESAGKYPPMVQEAGMLGLRAQAYMLAGSDGAPDAKQAAWRDLENQIATLDKEMNGALAVKFLRFQIALMQMKIAEADTLLAELEGQYPTDLRLMLSRAQLCESQGKEADAKAKYQAAIAQFPQDLEPVQAFAVFLERRGQREECEAAVKDAFARIPEPLARRNAGLLLAELYFRWQQDDKCLQWLTDLVAQYPGEIQPKRLLLLCESVRQDEAKSQQIIDEIKKIEGDQGPLWRYEQASLLLRSKSKDWQEALQKARDGNPASLRAAPAYLQITKLLQEALSANPEDTASRLILADIYELAGEQQLALTMYRETYARVPGNSQVLVRLVGLLHKTGEFVEAKRYLDAAGARNLLNPTLQRMQVDNDLSHGNLDSAMSTLQQLLEKDPNDIGLKLSYARVLILRNEFAQAEALLNDLRAKLSKSNPSELMLVARNQVSLYARQEATDKAVQVCNEMVDTLGNAAAYMLRADVYLALKENDKALQDLGQAILLEPKNVDTWQKRASAFSALGRMAEAVSDVRQALTLASGESSSQKLPVQKTVVRVFLDSRKPSLWTEAEGVLAEAQADPLGKNDPELSVLKADILVARGTGPAIEEARTILRQVTNDHPEYAAGWKQAARLELGQEELGRALDIATRGLAHHDKDKDLLLYKAIAEKRLSPSVAAMTTLPGLAEAYPDDVGIFIEWADAYARAEHPEKAVALLEQKLPTFKGASHRRCEIALAAALYNNAQEEKALTLFDTLITADANDPIPVMTLAGLLRKQARWTEVNQLVNRWRTLNPKDAETSTNVARLLAGSGDQAALQMAEDQLRMILEENPESVPTLVLLAMMMQDAGRDEEATQLNRRILVQDPNNTIAINNLAWLLCEEASPTPAMLKEALGLTDRGLLLTPEYGDLLDTRGVVYYRLGNLDLAIKDFTKCIGLFPKESPQSAAVHFHLARTFADQNRRSEAIEHLRLAILLNRKNVPLAEQHASEGRKTHAMKVLRDALALEADMDQLKTRFTPQDFVGIRDTDDWTRARLDLEQLQKGR